MRQVPLPSRLQLKKTYEQLQFDPRNVSLKKLVLWSQWSRLDARLGQILVEFLLANFEKINPLELWQENSKTHTPQTLAVLSEFTLLRMRSQPKVARTFATWCRACFGDLKPASAQLFFIPQGILNPVRIHKEVNETLRPYKKWGFFSNEWIAEEKVERRDAKTTLMNRDSRMSCLKELVKQKREITVSDYISACSGRIHRRTAERDLKASRLVKPSGQTRNRTYLSK